MASSVDRQQRPSPQAPAFFAFDPPPRPLDDPFDPFLSSSKPISNPWELLKAVVMLPVVLVRFVFVITGLLLAIAILQLALLGSPRWHANWYCNSEMIVTVLLYALICPS